MVGQMKLSEDNANRSTVYSSRVPNASAQARGYGVAVLSVGLAFWLTLLLQHFHFRAPSAPLLFAVVISSWYGGRGPAVLATILSTISFDWCFVDPVHSLYIGRSQIPYFLTFTVFAALLSWFGTVRRRLEQDLRQDIEGRKRAQATLREQANLLGLTHDAIFVRDMNSVITYWNRAAEEFYGWNGQEAIGSFSHRLLQTVLPVPVEDIQGELLRTGRWEGELVHTRKDGTKAIVASRWSLQRDEDSAPVAILETNNDITERKRAEVERERLRQLEADLAHINRVTMLGELAASLSHELKQPITASITNARTSLRWLKHQQPDLDEVRAAAERIENDGLRATEIIDRLRSLYKNTPPKEELIDVNDIVREMALLLRGVATRTAVSIRTDLAANMSKITADRVQMQQVLMNLMLNGIEAMNQTGGVLTISSRAENEHVLISVSDTGVGLLPEKADKIFDAFFTTKPQGSGMGLAISRSIVESHGGRLWATPNDGRGASFHFCLPTASLLAESAKW